MDDELYCPICGRHDIKLLAGKHRCTDKDLRAEERRLRRIDKPQRGYADRLAENKAMRRDDDIYDR